MLEHSSSITYRYCPAEAAKALELTREIHAKFLAHYGGALVVFPDGLALATAEQNSKNLFSPRTSVRKSWLISWSNISFSSAGITKTATGLEFVSAWPQERRKLTALYGTLAPSARWSLLAFHAILDFKFAASVPSPPSKIMVRAFPWQQETELGSAFGKTVRQAGAQPQSRHMKPP
jgi:hypothetical protein